MKEQQIEILNMQLHSSWVNVLSLLFTDEMKEWFEELADVIMQIHIVCIFTTSELLCCFFFLSCRTQSITSCWYSWTTPPWVYKGPSAIYVHVVLLYCYRLFKIHRGAVKTSLLICLLPLQPEEATEPTSSLVPFLQKYSDPRSKKPSVSI